MTPPDTSKTSDDTVRTKAGLGRLTRRAVGAIISIAFMVSGVTAGLMLASELDAQPRTEDAYTRANIIGIAPHVSGRILELSVVDNQPVETGDLLFVVDPRPYEIALAEAQAQLALVDLDIAGYKDSILAAEAEIKAAEARITKQQALAEYAAIYLERVEPLLGSRFVTPDQVDKARSETLALQASVLSAEADLTVARKMYQVAVTALGDVGDVNARRVAAQIEIDHAQLFLDYCYVTAPFDGYITNLNITVGEYANVGQQVFAIVDREIWYVMANFMETYLDDLEIGQTVEIYLMAFPGRAIKGRIQGIGWAITDTEGPTLDPIPTVSPTLDWVRLAQRFPVRIILEEIPEDVQIRMGATAAAIVLPDEGEPPKPMFPKVRAFAKRLGLAD